jgi:soluble lytic murein transglycosylase-like protein
LAKNTASHGSASNGPAPIAAEAPRSFEASSAIALGSAGASAATPAQQILVGIQRAIPAADNSQTSPAALQAAKKYDIPLGILFAAGLTETGIGGHLHAYALNLQGDTVYSLNKQRAMQRFQTAKASGMKWIDVGCMQLNWFYHGDRFSSVEEMFDPHKNVDYAARFLKELKQSERSWTLAVGRYNAGKNNDPAQKRYVCKVLARLVESGFGAWTSRSKAFCSDQASAAKAAAPKALELWGASSVQVH